MARITKKRKAALEKFDKDTAYNLSQGLQVVKDITYTSFDASVDIDVRLGVDPRKANQMVRGSVTLPHGTGKEVRVLVLCTPEKEEEAKMRALTTWDLMSTLIKLNKDGPM
jgi:large subunit ribosomal protein L1